ENEKSFQDKINELIEKNIDSIYILQCCFDSDDSVDDFIFVNVNAQAEKELSFSRNDLIGKRISDIFPIQKNAEYLDTYKKVFRTGITFEEEYSTPDTGNLRWYYHQIYPISDGVIIFNRDITDRKTAQQEKEAALHKLKESESRLKTYISRAPLGIFITDRTGTYTYANDTAGRMLGYRNNELIGMKFSDITPESFRKDAYDYFALLFEKGEISFETNLLTKDQKEISVTLDAVKLSDSEYMAYCRDVTELKKMEKENQNIQQKLEAFFSQSLDGFFFMMLDEPVVWNSETDREKLLEYAFSHQKITRVNQAMLDQYRASADQFIGLTPEDFFEHSIEEGKKIWRELFDRGKLSVETKERKFDGTEMIIEGYYICLYDSDGKIAGHFGIQRDVTEKKNAEKELISAKEKAEESERLKTAFLANMSHEIRTPLSAIIGFSGLLAESDDLNAEEKKEFADIIKDSAAGLLTLINDILDISRLDTGLLELRSEKFALNSLLKEIRTVYRLQKDKSDKKDIEIIMECGLQDEKSTVICDRVRLHQIISNLMSNAMKFTEIGYIKFGYSLKNGFLEFFVKDTGSGIPAEKQSIIFERFRQADEIHDRKYGGAGLGLSIVKGLVELFGGNIRLESVSGRGSIFYFTVPYQSQDEPLNLEKEDVSIPAEKKEARTELQDKRILIAEDTESNAYLLSKFLSVIGAEVVSVRNGKEAVEEMRSNPGYSLVLMDMDMPVMNGYAAAAKIREFNKEVPIIAQTAYAFGDDRQKCIDSGCTDYITKPLNRAAFLDLVKKYIS
ncbi:MAG TPA: PAS domain S-box protein, partial [Leptospiraceae bacterium]|nr:PAS domain S-box protein [Leptospiraceae bacterium]